MTQPNTSQVSQLLRRVRLDADVDETAKILMWMIVGILKNYYRDDYRLSLFSPSIGYDDLFQELLIELCLEVPKSFKEAYGVPYEAFTHMLLINKLRDLLKREGKHLRVTPFDAVLETAAEPIMYAISELESSLHVYDFAMVLSPQQRTIFLLRYTDYKTTIRDMATVTGASRSAVGRDLQKIRLLYLEYAMKEHLPLPMSALITTGDEDNDEYDDGDAGECD